MPRTGAHLRNVGYDDIGAAVDVDVGDHRQKLEPGDSIRLSTEFTPAGLDCLRLAIVGT